MHRIALRSVVCFVALTSNAALLASAEPPADQVAWQPLRLPKALVLVGPWGDAFGWREALHQQGILNDEGYRAHNVYHGGAQLYGAPTSLAEFARYSTVVLINIDAPVLGSARLAALRQFVQQGGGLVVLGGHWAFERGGYANTALAEMLPVTFGESYFFTQLPAGKLERGPEAALGLAPEAFDAHPRVYHINRITPKPGAVVELRVGEAPVLITGSFGEGRVVACALTVHGDPAPGELPFWDWKAWPQVLGEACEWAGARRPLRPDRPPTNSPRPLTAQEIEEVALELSSVDAAWLARFLAHPTAPAANSAFNAIFAEKSQVAISAPLLHQLTRFAQPSWEPQLRTRADPLNPDLAKREAALTLLGAARGPAASEVLIEALKTPDVAAAAVVGLRLQGDPAMIPILREIWEQAIVKADFRNPDLSPASNSSATQDGLLAVQAAIALYHLGDADGVQRLLDLHREIRLMRRVFANAAKRRVLGNDRKGMLIRRSLQHKSQDFSKLESLLLNASGPVPPSQEARLIALALSAADEADLRWLTEAVLRSPQGSPWAPLGQARDGVLRRLAKLP